MSYSAQVKAEVIHNSTEIGRDAFMALLSAVMKVSGALVPRAEGGYGFRITTENPRTARFLAALLKEYVDPLVSVDISRGVTMNRKNLYVLNLAEVRDLKGLLEETGFLTEEGGKLILSDRIPDRYAEEEEERRSYIKGAFLGSGSIAHPEKQYHMEFVTHTEAYANELNDLLAMYRLKGKVLSRKGSYIVYFKEGEQIVDILNVLGAHQSLLETENIRIIKDMRNNVNRLVNCETANLSKTVNAAVRQMEAIRHIERTVGLQRLPENLRQVAELRLEYPDASLKELGEMMAPPLGKSGINHRLRRIETIAEEIEKEG